MQRYQDQARHLAIFSFCLLNIYFGLYAPNAFMTAGGEVGLCYLLLAVSQTQTVARRTKLQEKMLTVLAASDRPHPPVPASCRSVDPNDIGALAQQMLDQGRYALLLRRQIAGRLEAGLFQQVQEALKDGMSLVPAGQVMLSTDEGENGVEVEPFFLDRFPVTNRQYYEFVAAGGYREIGLWDQTIWPAVFEMLDQTGQTGPRHWRNGCFARGEDELPVVGVCWYEAAACARWMGKRLPTDAEWAKAACWPVVLKPRIVVQRRYPWGDTMEPGRANLWDAGQQRVVPVGEFPEGATVNGVYQLIGNVWEWTSGDYRGNGGEGALVLPSPMKGIRGGAYDTYFDNQATGQFHSGESPLSRRHNLGFRCAVGACDLVLSRPATPACAGHPDKPAAAEAVEDHG